MAVLNLTYLKTLFQTFDKPTEDDFEDLIDTLSTTLRIVTYNVSGSGDVWTDVNSSTQILNEQKTLVVIYHAGVTYLFDGPLGTYGVGGLQTNTNNYINIAESQFTTEQVEAILSLIALDVTVIATLSMDDFESGTENVINYVANINYGDAVVSSIKMNQIPYTISTMGFSIVDYTSRVYYTKTYNLIVIYTLNGVSKQYNETLTTVGYIPQFYGLSPLTDYDGASTINIPLSKYIGESNKLSVDSVYTGMYLWFILSDDTPYVHDQNSNRFRHGSWSDDTFIIKKDGKIQLENGDYADVTFYRSYNTVNSMGVQVKCETK